VAVNSIYASIIPSYKYNLVLTSFSYGTQVMGHPVQYIQECIFKMYRNFTYEVVGQRRRLKAIKKNYTSKNKYHFIF
jgi:hypothetical protein